ncbi:MAG TPA: hypothetical protein VMD91_10010 [Candidatus Sulfotelmatobacter sp.]|nr:hypothetical protein [Candidatus Sulfotelmatobacter sp.]
MNPTAPQPLSIDALLGGSWRLFRANPTILVPIAVPFLLVIPLMVPFALLLTWAVAHPKAQLDDYAAGLVLACVLGAAVTVLLCCLGTAAAFAMANALWTRGAASVGAGVSTTLRRIGHLIVASVCFVVLEILALVLAIPTLTASVWALLLFSIYVIPAVTADRNGIEAFRESFALVRRWPGQSALTILILVALQYAISLVFAPFSLAFGLFGYGPSSGVPPQMPPVTLLVVGGACIALAFLLNIAYYGFFAIGLTGMYRSLRGLAEHADPGQPGVALPTEVAPGRAEG